MADRALCDHGRVNEITFVLPARQRILYLAVGGLAIAVDALGNDAGWYTMGASLLVGYFFVTARFRTTIDPTGVHVRRLSTRSVPWSRIQRIEPFRTATTSAIELHLGNGLIKLPAPITGLGRSDPQFDAKLAAIRTQLAAAHAEQRLH